MILYLENWKNLYPIAAAAIHDTFVANRYLHPFNIWFVWKKCNVSNENVENVVKPPQNPVPNNKNEELDIGNVVNPPNKNDPAIFIPIVTGYAFGGIYCKHPYLAIAPILPPNPTIANWMRTMVSQEGE